MPSSGQSAVSVSGEKKKKKGFIRSISGFSLKKKKRTRDDQSVTAVAIDGSAGGGAGSGSGGTSAPMSSVPGSSLSTPPRSLQVVLLLMDPHTRRFELLQLEFDSGKALVGDVLQQITCSATERSLREMAYRGACDEKGVEMADGRRLSEFCGGGAAGDIILAIPEGMSGDDTAVLARPILGDHKVTDMLRPAGVKIPKPSDPRRGGKAAGNVGYHKSSLDAIREENSSKKKRKRNVAAKVLSSPLRPILPTAVFMILIAALAALLLRHQRAVTRALESGEVLKPGTWRSRCGILDLLPENLYKNEGCRPSVLEMGMDGVLGLYVGRDRTEKWTVGEVALTSSEVDHGSRARSEGDLVSGAAFLYDEMIWSVVIGEERTYLDESKVEDLMPWALSQSVAADPQ